MNLKSYLGHLNTDMDVPNNKQKADVLINCVVSADVFIDNTQLVFWG